MDNEKDNQMGIDFTIILAALLLFVHPLLSLALIGLVAVHAIVTDGEDA